MSRPTITKVRVCVDCKGEYLERVPAPRTHTDGATIDTVNDWREDPRSHVCGACDQLRACDKHRRQALVNEANARTRRASQIRGLAKWKAAQK